MRSPIRSSVRVLFLAITFLAFIAAALAQEEPCGFFPALEGFKLRTVQVEPLFGKPPKQVVQALARHRGEPFTLTKGDQLKDEVKALLTSEWEEKVAAALGNNLAKSIKVAFHTWCVQRVREADCRIAFPTDNGQCVDVIVKSKVAQIDIIKAGNAMIPILHTSGLSLLPTLPRPILALNPSLGVSHDRAAGTGRQIEQPHLLHF